MVFSFEPHEPQVPSVSLSVALSVTWIDDETMDGSGSNICLSLMADSVRL